LGRKIKARLYTTEVLHDNKLRREVGDIEKHVIVIGFSKFGRIVSYILRKRSVNYLVLESNHRVVRIEKNKGYNIYYGDAMNIDILRYVGIERAESVIITMEDEIACMKITRFIHENFPNIHIITKSESINNANRFLKIGASKVISKNMETGLQLSHAALASVGMKNSEIVNSIATFREINPDILKDIVISNSDEAFKK
jgi:voltage-gated potassium channel Kch